MFLVEQMLLLGFLEGFFIGLYWCLFGVFLLVNLNEHLQLCYNVSSLNLIYG